MAMEAGKVVRPDIAAEGGLLDEDLVAMEPPNLEDISVIVRNKTNRTFLGGSSGVFVNEDCPRNCVRKEATQLASQKQRGR